ncbi:uncharacterized protein A4U43_C01F18850 [Asparagus officinalis]|uniref:Uncharacterized protein n=1 Tax=Asparagus officinalis TaxID=4686 RepID=A0A5P1FU45_ASPOF|nr:uncharacterized protein A4U43_C01F18850 [Asparagus officinalis]
MPLHYSVPIAATFAPVIGVSAASIALAIYERDSLGQHGSRPKKKKNCEQAQVRSHASSLRDFKGLVANDPKAELELDTLCPVRLVMTQ